MKYQYIPVDNLVRVYFNAPSEYSPQLVEQFFPGREPFVVEGKWCGIQCSFEEWDNWLAEMINRSGKESQSDARYQDVAVALALELAQFHEWQAQVQRTIFFKPESEFKQ